MPNYAGTHIIEAVESARQKPHIRGDANFTALNAATIGAPVVVATVTGKPAFWLVPFVANKKACGFATVTLSGVVSKMGIFGATPNTNQSWIDVSFFKKPPPKIVSLLKSEYAHTTLTKPLLSFDKSEDKWAWMVASIDEGNKSKKLIFITPQNWYETSAQSKDKDREG